MGAPRAPRGMKIAEVPERISNGLGAIFESDLSLRGFHGGPSNTGP
jgi:hypothetical protein